MQQNKIEAIYDLREAAEHKGKAEVALEREATPQTREALLNAQLELESKTQDAIEACHECGHEHPPEDPHGKPSRGRVIDVDFRKSGTTNQAS